MVREDGFYPESNNYDLLDPLAGTCFDLEGVSG